MTYKEAKQICRDYLKGYPDDRLAALLAHAQSGKLAWYSCCCFAGALEAQHPLQTSFAEKDTHGPHFGGDRRAWERASFAYMKLAYGDDAKRRRIIIPMIRAEMRYRERARQHEAAVQQFVNFLQTVEA